MSLVWGAVCYVGLLAGLAWGMYGCGLLVARLLGVQGFRWFAVRPAPAAWWRRFSVRLSSSLVPLVVSVALTTAALLVSGAPELTTKVLVMAGAARDAGMQDGDEVLAVAGVRSTTWEALRATIQRQAGPTRFELKRAGVKQELWVTPRAGRVGVSPISELKPVGVGAALRQGLRIALTVPRELLKTVAAARPDAAVELTGPVGIVKETANAPKGSLFGYLGVVAAYLWPLLAATHLFDVGTFWIFRLSYPGAVAEQPGYRVARLWQALVLGSGCYVTFCVAGALVELGLGAVALALLFVSVPSVLGLGVAVWIAAAQRWGRWAGTALSLAAVFIPCVLPAVGLWLAVGLRRQLVAQGFAA